MRGHHKLADEEQNNEQTDAESPAPVNELEFGFIQGLILHVLDLFMELDFFIFHLMLLMGNRLGADHGRGHAVEESVGNKQTNPDDEAEQAHDVHNGETADTFLLKLTEI